MTTKSDSQTLWEISSASNLSYVCKSSSASGIHKNLNINMYWEWIFLKNEDNTLVYFVWNKVWFKGWKVRTYLKEELNNLCEQCTRSNSQSNLPTHLPQFVFSPPPFKHLQITWADFKATIVLSKLCLTAWDLAKRSRHETQDEMKTEKNQWYLYYQLFEKVFSVWHDILANLKKNKKWTYSSCWGVPAITHIRQWHKRKFVTGVICLLRLQTNWSKNIKAKIKLTSNGQN